MAAREESGGAEAPSTRAHAPAFPTAGIPASRRLELAAFRNGAPLGRHAVAFSEHDGALVVDISIDYTVKFGPITFFRYKLRGHETWINGALASASARTDSNGKSEFMRLQRDGDALIVEGSKTRRARLSQNCLVATHWNIAQLDGPMINPQDGSLLRFSVEARGPSKLVDAAGVARVARRYALKGVNPLELWYEDSGAWVGLRAKAFDGSVISYTPTLL
jgi:hypothetical protein